MLLKSNLSDMRHALEDVQTKGAGWLQILDADGCNLLLQETHRLSFRDCRKVAGTDENPVVQDFRISLNFPEETELDEFSAAFERQLNAAFASMREPPVSLPYHFNDRALLIYDQGSKGISPHRDHECFEGVVAILTLGGKADFYICDDRKKNNSILYPAEPGGMIIMRGANYLGLARPFHYLENVTAKRYGFGLRFNAHNI